MKNNFKHWLNKSFAFSASKKGNISLGAAVGIGSFVFSFSAYHYFKAFNSSFGINDFLTSDLIRILNRLASDGLLLVAAALVFFLVASTPIIAPRFSDIVQSKRISNGAVLLISVLLALFLGWVWTTFIKNEILWPTPEDMGIFIAALSIVLISVFYRRKAIYSLFFFLPFAFAQRGYSDARLITKYPIKFTLEYKDGESVNEIKFDGKDHLFIDQSERFVHYKELWSGKVKRIDVNDIVSTSATSTPGMSKDQQ
ncbi:MAG: hypothetical protein ACTHZ1_10490 [Sphingobacterium sp.]